MKIISQADAQKLLCETVTLRARFNELEIADHDFRNEMQAVVNENYNLINHNARLETEIAELKAGRQGLQMTIRSLKMRG